MAAKVNARASGWKWCCCCNPYEIAAVIELSKLVYEPVDVYLGDQKVIDNVTTPFFMNLTGKHGGNGMLINPVGLVNDGLNEFMYVKTRMGAAGLVRVMD